MLKLLAILTAFSFMGVIVEARFTPHYELEFFNFSPFPNMQRRNYTAFTCWLSCDGRTTVLCHYMGFKHEGDAKRPSSFTYDPLVSRTCQQMTTNSYNSIENGWDRGHMVAANHMDHNETTIKESMHMTNIMPQTAILNQQAYRVTEVVYECYRDVVNLNTIVGIILGTDTSNDYFVNSHGVKTPDWYWRIIEKEIDGDVIAWIIPNDNTATRANIDKYLVSISEIERRAGLIFTQFTQTQKNKIATKTWENPKDCTRSKLADIDSEDIGFD